MLLELSVGFNIFWTHPGLPPEALNMLYAGTDDSSRAHLFLMMRALGHFSPWPLACPDQRLARFKCNVLGLTEHVDVLYADHTTVSTC